MTYPELTEPMERFESAVAALAAGLGPSRLRALAERIEENAPRSVVLGSVPGAASEVAAIYDAVWDEEDLSVETAGAYLRGVAAGLAHQKTAVRIELVWSGPSVHGVPVRATAQVLIGLIEHATSELMLMTYSARPYEPLREALGAAVRRGVVVMAVVETLQGAGSAISGEEPAMAFHGLGVELWHWPAARRAGHLAKMHAKIAVADRRELLVSSANLTQSGVGKNIEAGLLVRGGTAPQRAAEHITALRSAGMLERL
jgi:phosphatidylserine/phosphatidylglycerophosphate/cardiolipin synthase-like enzyme